jgi:hypothetical protein
MPLRGSLLDNFAGDLEYHPRRGAVYLALAVAAFCCFYFAPGDTRFTSTPLIFAFGACTLFVKGVFLCRKSSEGIGLTETDFARLSSRKYLPSIPNLVAQIIQDFGAGPFVLGSFLRLARDADPAWDSTELQVVIAGLVLFGLGWVVRRATKSSEITE